MLFFNGFFFFLYKKEERNGDFTPFLLGWARKFLKFIFFVKFRNIQTNK